MANQNAEPMQIDIEENRASMVNNVHMVMNPSLDLESYSNSYFGVAKVQRLEFIADHCPPLRIEALKMAIFDVMLTYNVAAYQRLHQKLVDAIRQAGNVEMPDVISRIRDGHAELLIDQSWIDSKTKKSAIRYEKLDAALKASKNNSLKESIRRGHDDIGDHYLDCGDFDNALKSYTRSRNYCTSSKHIINAVVNLVKVGIYLKNWHHVINCVTKTETSFPDAALDQKELTPQVKCYLKCTLGLAEMSLSHYKTAAKSFLDANIDHCDFPDIMSPNNIALYGGLCALASFNRSELQTHIISSVSFKQFLELEPNVREIIYAFYHSKYAICLSLLNDLKENLFLDLYLASHVNALYAEIRKRAIVQYTSPYVSADMRKMAAALNTTVAALEQEVCGLIFSNELRVRIDSKKKIIYAMCDDYRNNTFTRVISVGKFFTKGASMMIVKTAMPTHHVVIQKL